MYTILLCKVTIFAFNCKMKATIFLYSGGGLRPLQHQECCNLSVSILLVILLAAEAGDLRYCFSYSL